LCVDLRSFRDATPDVLAAWRESYAKGIGGGALLFAMPGGMLLRQNEQESQSSVRLDGTWTRKAELHTPDELRRLIDRENGNAFDIVVAQLRSPVGFVPFVGAGLSVPFGFPGWPKFLKEAAAFHRSPDKVLALVKRNRLIEAASLLFKPSADRFQRLVERWFGAPVADEQVRKGAVSLLPLICKGPTITTNFDRVLETAFGVAGFKFDRPITALEPDNVIRAMHRNEHVLIKIHGDALDRSARVFTGVEYRRQYGSDNESHRRGRRVGIPTLARIMFTNRPLFLGCSLEKDQTLDVLRGLHREVPGITHYAVLAADFSIAKLRRRRDELSRYGINPLWFSPGDFGGIESILNELLHEASTRLIWRSPKPETALVQSTEVAARPPTAVATPAIAANTDLSARLTRRLALRLAGGQIAFFLGAGIHLGLQPSALDFYSSLSEDYGFSDEDAQRAEVAQYLIDREGKSHAWLTMKQKLMGMSTKHSTVCEFLADLPELLRQLRKSDQVTNQWLLTTNYDVALEAIFAARGERFHLLSYQVDGENEGHFAHRDAVTGSIRIIERPENILRMGDSASVIVKLDGGISWDPNIPETVAISPLDFSVSSGRLIAALPEAVRQVLQKRSLLVLGSSLRDPHIQRVVRWSAGSSRAAKTWAVMKPVTATAAQYWPAAGVELIDRDLTELVVEIRRELESLLDRS
jgi:hypothetical protein